MKKHIIRIQNTANRFKYYASALIITLLLNKSTSAQLITDSSSFIKTALIKHIPSEENKKLFHVQLNNEKGEKFSISIKDNYGQLLFSEVYQDKKFDKKYLLTNMEDEERVFIIIRSLRNKEAQLFEISTQIRTFHDYVVTRL